MTRAQWLWFLNLICFALHVYYAFLIWSETLDRGVEFEATVWRTHPVWNASVPDGQTAVLVDNLKPIRVDLLVGGFFLISALFHALLVGLGPFDRWIWIYWRQLDLCFNYWRWCAPTLTQTGVRATDTEVALPDSGRTTASLCRW